MISRQRFSLSFRQMLLQRHMCASLPPASGYIDADDHQHSVPCLPPAHVFSSLSSNEPMAYSRGWALQQVLLQQRLELRRQTETPNDSDQILMLQHSPVYTLGRGADENHLTFLPQDDVVRREALSRITRGSQSARLSVDKQFLVTEETFWSIVDDLSNGATPVLSPNNAPIYRIDRGGEVTFHGPGKLVVYPMLDLKRAPMKTDLHWYLRMVEEVIIQVLKEYDIVGKRNEINTGVWVGDSKLAAIGVSSSRWITTHGFAINVAPDLEYFDTAFILPCGIAGRGVTSIEEVLIGRGESESSVPSLGEVSLNVLTSMQQLFGIDANRNYVEIPGTGSLIGHVP